MKVEAKSKENQRLSMQNEQLQFRLQSHPNLSGNDSILLNNNNNSSSNNYESTTSGTPGRLDGAPLCSSSLTKARTKSTLDSSAHSSGDTATCSLPVKLRSKSFKTTSTTKTASSTASSKENGGSLLAEQFRPVSENFDYDVDDQPAAASSHGRDHVSDRDDFLMTRSVIVYDSSSASSASNPGESGERADEFDMMMLMNNIESSSCSSNSHLDQNPNQSPVSSESCLKSLEERTINYAGRARHSPDHHDAGAADNSMSASIVSINEPSIIILD